MEGNLVNVDKTNTCVLGMNESSMHWTVLCGSEAFHNSKSLRKKCLSFKLSECVMIVCMIDEVYSFTLIV